MTDWKSAGRKAHATRKAREGESTDHLSKGQIAVLKLARGAASSAMSRAKHEGVQFDPNFNLGLVELLERQSWCCALIGIPFGSDQTSLGAGGRDYAPSPDRIEPAKGYAAGNVQWILWAVNRAKGRMPPGHFRHVFRTLGKMLEEGST